MALSVALCALATAAHAQTAANVLLVVNQTDLSSTEIGNHYRKVRGLDDKHVVSLKTSSAETITRRDYERTIETPIAQWLTKHSLQDQILYVVLTKGIPLRIIGTPGREGTTASVDSELTLLYRKMTGAPVAHTGRVANPYYAGDAATNAAKTFSRHEFDIFLVTRLDGFNTVDAIGLIDRGSARSSQGRVVLDVRGTMPDRAGDTWLEQAAENLKQAGEGARVMLESTRAAATPAAPVIGYYSWGSNDAAIRQRRLGITFEPGAIGGMFLSSDARTFKEPPVAWAPFTSELRDPLFGPGSQSLAGDLIRDGITGLSANVAEPYMDAMVRPQVLFPAYLAGRNLAEAFYLAMPFLSWQTVVVGDPLCSPFAKSGAPGPAAAKPIDPDTELPGFYSERRLALMSKISRQPDVLKLLLKAESRMADDPTADVESILRRVLTLEPGLTQAKLQLALSYEARKEFDKAIAEYRGIVEKENHAIALNNLAYTLAVQKNELVEAQALAEKALLVSRSPFIADTLGWIHYLTGDYRKALPYLEYAASGAPDSTDVLLHLASVYTELGDKLRARAVLDALVALDDAQSEKPEVKKLRERVKVP